ncbi:MAG: quinolinate synthase NadA [Phycisphaerales bacterium]|nr:quinolinate synthase NadA [Phycisphaerales bacterium]
MNAQSDLVTRILELKNRRNAIILAHNYQLGEVQDIADFVGDSLELSRKAAGVEADVIVFCGVHFMAETAKILSPNKTVLLPDIHAGCPMADMINAVQLREFKAQYPGMPVVAYVNTSAEVKAESDVCCTSANAVRVVESVDAPEVLFVPDKSLGAYVASKTSKSVVLYPGYCPTHHRILSRDVMEQKAAHPNAKVVAHPECTMDVIGLADAVASTSGIIRYVAESKDGEFIICTERGLLHRLRKDNPDKQFYNPGNLNVCPNMKKITLEKVLWSLEDMVFQIEVLEDVIRKARTAIERMLAV